MPAPLEGQPAFATEGVVDGPEEGVAPGARIVTTNLARRMEKVDVPGGVAEEAMDLRPVSVSSTATGEDDFGHERDADDPARDDHHECLVGRGCVNWQ